MQWHLCVGNLPDVPFRCGSLPPLLVQPTPCQTLLCQGKSAHRLDKTVWLLLAVWTPLAEQ